MSVKSYLKNILNEEAPKKIELYFDGEYLSTTTRAKTQKQAKDDLINALKFGEYKGPTYTHDALRDKMSRLKNEILANPDKLTASFKECTEMNEAKEKVKKFKNKDGVYFWSEPVEIGKTNSWHIVQQMPGYPATEAHDDWFANKKDADEIAEKLSKDEIIESISNLSFSVINEKMWSGNVSTKWEPKEGFFTQSAEKIASGLKRASKDLKQAMSRLNFYRNRSGSNLSAEDKKRLELAKEKLRKLYE